MARENVKNLEIQRFSVTRNEALLFVTGSEAKERTTESVDREVEEITDYIDNLGRTVFYAINFKNESGYLLFGESGSDLGLLYELQLRY